jgi:hypothetical protein
LKRRDQPIEHAADARDARLNEAAIVRRTVPEPLGDFDLDVHFALRTEGTSKVVQVRFPPLAPGTLTDVRWNRHGRPRS